jgi:glycerophosphoryl diester phosphodiesterase
MRHSRVCKVVGLVAGMTLLAAQSATAAVGDQSANPASSTPCSARLISAHEGWQAKADGDTVASQVAAFRIGASFADSDVWVTKDGYIIQMHSNDVSDSTNGHGLVTEMTLSQILALRTQHFHNPIPTLDDSLAIPRAHQPGRYLMFESKFSFASHENLDMLAAHIDAAGMTNHVVIYSAYPNQLTYLEQIDPGITTWFKAGAIPPVSSVTGYDGVMLDAAQMTAENVAEFHAAGLTVIRQRSGESPAKWQAFLTTGADGLMSDHATTVIKWCRQLG